MALEFSAEAAPQEAACTSLAGSINEHLEAGQQVLWLLSGGSNVSVAVEVAHRLRNVTLANLTVILADERYVQPGHHDSNWQQLLDAGLDLPGAALQPTLLGQGFDATVSRFYKDLDHALTAADWSVALLGMGTDGHIAGILPGSPAVTSADVAVGYEAADYTRITITSVGLARLDEVVLVAAGQAKQPQLERLHSQLDVQEQPAQALKRVPTVHIYTNKELIS